MIEINPLKLQPIEKKMASLLAADRNLKESAQRAFQAYIKSVFLMKDKNTFDVHKIDLEKFAESLGLAAAPRVRFLDKQKKILAEQQQKKKKTMATEDDLEQSKSSENQSLGADRVAPAV